MSDNEFVPPATHLFGADDAFALEVGTQTELGQGVLAARMEGCRIICGDALAELRALPDAMFRCCVTSPPYWGLRDYGMPNQIGAEFKLEDYVKNIRAVFREVFRVLAPDGTLWLNIGDSYTSGGRTWRQEDKKNKGRGMDYRPPTPDGLKPKDLIGVPWRLAFGLQEDGWYLRSDVIWHKPNCQPESVRDRPTRSHEYVFLLTKSERYYYDWQAIREQAIGQGQKNRRTVWSINTEACPEAHFATMPTKLIEPCILAGSAAGDHVLDPFFGAGTVGLVSLRHSRKFTGIEINAEYAAMARRRLGWSK